MTVHVKKKKKERKRHRQLVIETEERDILTGRIRKKENLDSDPREGN